MQPATISAGNFGRHRTPHAYIGKKTFRCGCDVFIGYVNVAAAASVGRIN
jgi:hypothetical protein